MYKSNPKLSIIVPNYNHASFLEKRLESIINQTYQDYELIVLDDYSTDNSIEIIEKEKNKREIITNYNKQNSGSTYKQWKKGIEMAKGKYIWVAESDDLSSIYFLEKVIKKIEKNNLVLCFCNSMIINKYGESSDIWDKDFAFYSKDTIFSIKDVKDWILYKNIIPNASAVVFKKDVAIKYLNEVIDYTINGDWYLWINLMNEGKSGFIYNPYNYFRRHEGASSPKNVVNFNNIEEAFRIQIFLKSIDLNYDIKYWSEKWLEQASFSLQILLKHNFHKIYKTANKLDKFFFLYLIKSYIKAKIRRIINFKS